MKQPIPVALFELLEEYKDDPNKPDSIEDIPLLITKCVDQGLFHAAKQLERWLLYISQQMEAEWDEKCLMEPID